jgi:hypothetical protein
MAYYTPVGPLTGSLRYSEAPAANGVLASRANPLPVGLAPLVGWDDDGVALWRLSICGAMVPGLCVVVDREFRLAR